MEGPDLKRWKNAGAVARRALDHISSTMGAGQSWHSVIESAERYIRRHGGTPAFPCTLSVNDIAAHYTTNHSVNPPEGIEEMILRKGDLVKLDIGVHVKGAIGDNAITIEIGNGNNHTEQIKAAKDARDASIELMHPGTPWHEIGAAAEQVAIDAGFQPIRNLSGHQLEKFNLHAGVSVPSFACGSNHPGYKGTVPLGGVFAIEPFNTTGTSGIVENISPHDSSNIFRVTGNVNLRQALAKKKIKPLGATMARYIEERYHTLPFAERWAFPLLEKPFPNEDEESHVRKWNALIKKLQSIRFVETYAALKCADGGMVGQCEHTVYITEGGPEILTVP